MLALVTVASADNGPHGGFTATTDACAGCHRAHTAQFGSNALLITDPEDLCMSCHGGGAGAYHQRREWCLLGTLGRRLTGNPLFGGGFTNALMATAWSWRDYRKPGLQCHLAPHDVYARRGRCWHDLGLGRQQQRQWSDGARMHLLP